MGGLLHLFDFYWGSMARKILAHKRHVDGLEAPRNSMELQAETSQSCYAAGDGLYPYHVEDDWSEKNCYPIEASMKRLINEEISKQSNSKKNAPSIVARLMGVDTLPLDSKSVVHPVDRKSATPEAKFAKKEKSRRNSISHLSSESISSGFMELDSLYFSKETDGERSSHSRNLEKPRPREHPQEEELQKFKKEFEAWQAARFKEYSKVVELGNSPDRLFEHENSYMQKMVLNANSHSGMHADGKNVEHRCLASKARLHDRIGSQHHRHRMEPGPAQQKEVFSSRDKAPSRNSGSHTSFIDYDQKLEESSAPTRIVILKPGPDRICDHDESWTCSSGTFEDRCSIEDFLEEVKERLKRELQGKTHKRASVVRGSGIETPFSEKPSDPKQIARHIAKHMRESVTRDIGMNLLRSESTRSYRSEIQFNGPGSPEFINRDTRRFLSERLRNVVTGETSLHVPAVVSGSSASYLLDGRYDRLKHGGNSKSRNKWGSWEIMNDEDMQTRSFRHGDDDGVLHRELSPRNLIRSLSAPVSGTSFGKLLLEDRHILTGAQIRRKHEVPENVKVEPKKSKKEKFNIKEKVSNFRYSFTLRGRLFRKKIQSTVESHGSERELVKDMMSGPAVVMNFAEKHVMENSTEVPPSPASVCSSAQEEFWRPVDYISPVSTPDITLEEDNSIPQFFKDISSNLKELRRQLHHLESDKHGDITIQQPEETTGEQEAVEYIMADIEDKAEAYIRDLLVASGLYHGSSEKCLSRREVLAKPISNSVFEEVEQSYENTSKCNEANSRGHHDNVDHKILFDLLNEALSSTLGPPMAISRLRGKIVGSSMLLPPLDGRKLLDCMWGTIREYLYPSNDKSCYSLDNMVAKTLQVSPWCGLIDDEVSALANKVECQVFGDLIDEIVKDMHS